jgi:DHA2 family multidrug resistance protein
MGEVKKTMSQTIPTHRVVANRGLLVVWVMLATLMQALDTTIANVALPNMQGSLSATQDQISWVLTSYIVAAAIATPATGWLASVMGRRRLLLIAIAGFTFASVLCGMATSIGALQLCLDRGEQKDWWGSTEIQIEAALAFLGFYLYAVHWKTRERSFLDLGLFKDRNFLASNVFIFVLGVVLFATMALLPPFLQNIMNYPVVTTGILLAPRGIGTLIAMMLVGRLMARGADARILAAIGMTLTCYSLWQMMHFSLDVPEHLIVTSGVIQGLGLGLVFVPISTVAYSTLPMSQRTEAAGIFSLMRNIGSSVGISIVMTLLSRNTQINHAEIASRLTPYGDNAQQLQQMLGQNGASGLAMLNGEVTRQASGIAFLNDFWLMMVMTAAAIPLLLLLKPVKGRAAPAVVADH